MTIETTVDVIIELIKPVALFAAGVAAEAIRRWISAPKKEKVEFIDVSSEALKDGKVTLLEGLAIFKEGKDVWIGVDIASDYDDTMGKQ